MQSHTDFAYIFYSDQQCLVGTLGGHGRVIRVTMADVQTLEIGIMPNAIRLLEDMI